MRIAVREELAVSSVTQALRDDRDAYEQPPLEGFLEACRPAQIRIPCMVPENGSVEDALGAIVVSGWGGQRGA